MPGSLKQKNVIRLFTFSKYIIMLNGTQEQFQSSEVVVKAEVILHCSSVCFIFAACMCFIKLSAENVYILRKESISKKMFLRGNQVFILLNSSFNISYKFIQINISAFVSSSIWNPLYISKRGTLFDIVQCSVVNDHSHLFLLYLKMLGLIATWNYHLWFTLMHV